MNGERHPDTDAIASLAAGFVSGIRARRLAAHVASCDRCAAVSEQLGAVSSTLAAAPVPALPEAVERQISAAIATEAASRAAAPGAADTTPAGVGADRGAADGLQPSPSPSSRPRHARSRGQGSLRLRPAMAIVPVVACLLAGFGYLLSHVGASSSSSEPVSAAAPSSVPSAAASSSAGAGPVRNAEPRPAEAFAVVNSGIRYQAATLGAQVGGELKTVNDQQPGDVTPVPSASASAAKAPVDSSAASGAGNAAGAVAAPSPTLIGCVLQVTGSIRPSLVDRAFYQGKPVYVIAVRDKAWVVGRGCTASDTELITSVSLTGTP